MRRFRRTREGRIAVALAAPDAELLASLPAQLVALLEAPAGDDARPDPALDRLFPHAYLDPTEEEAERQWRALVLPDLVRRKLDAAAVVGDSLARARTRRGRSEVELEPEEADAWLGALNDLRLVLGTRLGVTDDTDPAALARDHPQAPQYALYAWLTWIQGDLVEALLP